MFVPSQWKYIIADYFQNRKFFIVEVESNDFKKFHLIENGLIKNNSKFKITQYLWLKMTRDYPLGISDWTSHNILKPFSVYNVISKKALKRLVISPSDLPQMLFLSQKKKRKIWMDMTKYILQEEQKRIYLFILLFNLIRIVYCNILQ